ncbi:mechanosensitive ion channel [Aurantimonas sp. Leaf443]|uniref:mechanosensitive ion channel family protein n=1 Tax=Aurantimonas sp. Leaf443 TaxID=1736378 RepID=UPI0006F7D7E7|nr:mechanosensitive ion channel [Aurantimonas sp. Leaf443]KQT83897.1 hypothetical protein ASG48_10910 [Aurantimonas sp. Leaf443]
MQDPSFQASEQFLRTLADRAAQFLPNLFVAALILVAGFLLARWLGSLVTTAFARAGRLDPTVRAPLVSIVRYGVIVLALVAALGQVGVQMTSLLAVLGAAGLAIGLALQGTLANIAAGIMLLWLRPFRVGDYVETQLIAGTVREIGLFVCHLETYDGLFVFAPNSTLWNVWLRNHSRAGHRLFAYQVTLARALPFEEARRALEGAARETLTAGRAPTAEPLAFLDQLGADSQIVTLRCIVAAAEAGAVLHALPERMRAGLLTAFGEAGGPVSIQRTVPGDADPVRYVGAARAA